MIVCPFVAVKYLREVTPYFRQASSSVLAEIGWTSPDDSASSSKSERSIPLRLCYVCRGGITDGTSDSMAPGADGPGRANLIELRSPDAKNCVLLRCPDEDSAIQWLSAIGSVVSSLTPRAVLDVNALLTGSATTSSSIFTNGTTSPNNNNSSTESSGVLVGEVKHLGWLAEQVS